MTRVRSSLAFWLVLLAHATAFANYIPSTVTPPPVPREFRGFWVASVKNIDWPSKPGLPVADQKAELVSLLDRAQRLQLNAVLLQVRPSCDALYASRLEPWSEYLTGQMGRAPQPYYDPLAFAVAEAHKRGLELHAWFNPYRARHAAALSSVSSNHISRTRPALVRQYAQYLWLDPGEREVQEHSLNVVLDVVKRYDIDGVHFDDYFYPYPEKDPKGRVLVFPDWRGWQRYKDGGGKLEREDWRRENVNLFLLRVSQAIRTTKPWVKFGISPFGIWRPGFPPQIKGLDSYDALYADSRKWLREGWVDYMAPQLYWGDDKRETSFSALLNWWGEENVRHRHVWPGLALSRVGPDRPAQEIVRQVQLTRKQAGVDGNILWSVRALLENRRGLADALASQVYQSQALLPAYPWLDNNPPARPQITASAGTAGETILNWTAPGPELVWTWLVQMRVRGAWKFDVLNGNQKGRVFLGNERPEVVAVTALDRCGIASQPAVVEFKAPTAAAP